jgi:hypothetical protein
MAGERMADDDKAGLYTVEIRRHAIGDRWTSVMAHTPVEAATLAMEEIASGRPCQGGIAAVFLRTLAAGGPADGPDGHPVLIVRAVAGWDRPIADDLADAITAST